MEMKKKPRSKYWIECVNIKRAKNSVRDKDLHQKCDL